MNTKLENTQRYLGVKFVNSKPMTLGEYNKFRSWTIPKDEDPEIKGYIVQYPDNYISWCPEQQFIDANTLITDMPFGHAIEAMKKGYKVARKGWNGANMFVYYIPANLYSANENVLGTMKGIFPNDMVPYRHYLALKTAQNDVATWAPSTSDALATDWFIVE